MTDKIVDGMRIIRYGSRKKSEELKPPQVGIIETGGEFWVEHWTQDCVIDDMNAHTAGVFHSLQEAKDYVAKHFPGVVPCYFNDNKNPVYPGDAHYE